MNKYRTTFLIAALFSIIYIPCFAQCTAPPALHFQNPSFEGSDSICCVPPPPWSACGHIPPNVSSQLVGYPTVETPDVQPGWWGVGLTPASGSTYVGLVWDSLDYVDLIGVSGWVWQEGVAQQLDTPMAAGTFYTIAFDLANIYQSSLYGIRGAAECRIWGGYNTCDENTLLWHSGNIQPVNTWIPEMVTFTPSQNFTWILFQIQSLDTAFDSINHRSPYILIDNLKSFDAAVVPNVMLSRGISCHSANDAVAAAHTMGLHPPFSYTWNTVPVQTDSVISGLGPGSYSVTVTDALGCSAAETVTVSDPPPLSVTLSSHNSSCGDSTGNVVAHCAGGTMPYYYFWSNGSGNQGIYQLPQGNYSVTITDGNGCIIADSIALIQNGSVMNITGTIVNRACNVANGSISVIINGGVPPYIYHWSSGQTVATISGLAAGSYSLTVTDSNSCFAFASFVVGLATNNLTATVVVDNNVQCYGQNTGVAHIIATGGVPGYSYAWNNSQTTDTATGLYGSLYWITVTDAALCTVGATVNIAQNPQIRDSLTVIRPSCNALSDGSFTVFPYGGTPPFTFVWNTLPVQTTPTAINLPVGTYSVIITDSLMCSDTVSVVMYGPTPLRDSMTRIIPQCLGGTATCHPYWATPPYTFSWSNGSTGNTITGLDSGYYYVTITDAHGCQRTDSIFIPSPSGSSMIISGFGVDATQGNSDGIAWVLVGNGTPPYHYTWQGFPGNDSSILNNIPAGTYIVEVIDSNGCAIYDTIVVGEISGLNVLSKEPIYQVLPRPSKGYFQVLIGNYHPGITLTIENIIGQKLIFIPLESSVTNFDVSSFAAGVYFALFEDCGERKIIELIIN